MNQVKNNHDKVYCFEVEPTNFKTLTDNIILNKLTNVIPLNIGISSNNLISKLFYNTLFNSDKDFLPQSGQGSHSITFDKKLHRKDVLSYVPLMTFNSIISTFSLFSYSYSLFYRLPLYLVLILLLIMLILYLKKKENLKVFRINPIY